MKRLVVFALGFVEQATDEPIVQIENLISECGRCFVAQTAVFATDGCRTLIPKALRSSRKKDASRGYETSKIIGTLHYQRMRIGELAKSVDVNVETIRYYQRIGLLELPKKPYGGTRYYSSEDLKRLRFIRRAQQIGFSLEDIRALLELSSSDCEQVGKLAAQQLNLVHAKLRQLRRIESVLAKTIEQCARRKGDQPCPIIDALSES